MIKKLKSIPWWGYLSGFLIIGLQYVFYSTGNLIAKATGRMDSAFLAKIPAIDDKIPLVPIFTVIYLFSYVFWICGPIAASLTSKKNYINYVCGLFLAYIIGFVIFAIFPSYIDREAEGLIELANQKGFFYWLERMIFFFDGKTKGYNLFPSFHCLSSLYCYLGIRKQKEISRVFKIYSIIMTILICLSTVFTKQHFFIDIWGGLALGIICYSITYFVNPAERYFNKLLENEKVDSNC